MDMFNPKKYKLVYRGSSKDSYRADKTSRFFHFLDFFSVFDVGRHPDPISGKGQAICACAVKSAMIAKALGIPTCFIEQVADDAIRVHEAQVITDRNLTAADENYVLPAELIDRHKNAGSFARDFKSGARKPEHYGFPAGVVPPIGASFAFPVEHITTKFEPTDRTITPAEACLIGGITPEELRNFWNMIHRLKGAIHYVCLQAGYAILDGKTEGIVGPRRRLMLGDVVVTQDEDRPVLAEPLSRGIIVHHNKEFLREYMIDIGYHDAVKAARKAGQSDPPYPPLPDSIIADAADRYNAFAKAYTSVGKFSIVNVLTGACVDNY